MHFSGREVQDVSPLNAAKLNVVNFMLMKYVDLLIEIVGDFVSKSSYSVQGVYRGRDAVAESRSLVQVLLSV